MYIHTSAINYLARNMLKQHGMDSLTATPFLVIIAHRNEQLERSVSVWYSMKTLQGRLEVVTCAAGGECRLTQEDGDWLSNQALIVSNIKVTINDKKDKLMSQEMHEGQLRKKGGLR